jgi:hypothetical protein
MLKWYPVVAAAVFALFLALFLIAQAWGVPVLTDPTPQLRQAGAPAAFLGVALLLADAVLPVPSSLVMIAHGAAFGVALGTLLSVIGSTGAALVGFGLGRRGGPLLDRFSSPRERSTADRLLKRWGVLAIVLTRSVPLLAETVAVRRRVLARQAAGDAGDASRDPTGGCHLCPDWSGGRCVRERSARPRRGGGCCRLRLAGGSAYGAPADSEWPASVDGAVVGNRLGTAWGK